MKNYLKSTVAFGLAVSMLAAPAFAQQDNHDNGQHDQHSSAPQNSMMQHEPAQHQSMQQHAPMQHQTMQHEPMQRQTMQPQHQQMAGPSHHWQHGQHYNGSRRVVNNWQSYHLRQPPHGYEWVQDGSQFVLIAVTSGIIADVIANALSH